MNAVFNIYVYYLIKFFSHFSNYFRILHMSKHLCCYNPYKLQTGHLIPQVEMGENNIQDQPTSNQGFPATLKTMPK